MNKNPIETETLIEEAPALNDDESPDMSQSAEEYDLAMTSLKSLHSAKGGKKLKGEKPKVDAETPLPKLEEDQLTREKVKEFEKDLSLKERTMLQDRQKKDAIIRDMDRPAQILEDAIVIKGVGKEDRARVAEMFKELTGGNILPAIKDAGRRQLEGIPFLSEKLKGTSFEHKPTHTISSADDMHKLVERHFPEVFKAAETGSITMKTILRQAAKLDQDVYRKLLKANRGGGSFSPKVLARGLIEIEITRGRAASAAIKVQELLSQGNFSSAEEALTEFIRAIHLNTAITANVVGDLSTAGQKLAVKRHFRGSPDLPFLEKQSHILDQVKSLYSKETQKLDLEQARRITAAYLTLSKSGKQKLSKRISREPNLADAWAEGFLNALLSSPITHMVNLGGNFAFNVVRGFEYGLAGLMGEGRHYGSKLVHELKESSRIRKERRSGTGAKLEKDPETPGSLHIQRIPFTGVEGNLRLRNVLGMVSSIRSASRLAIANLSHTFKKGVPLDDMTKIDARRQNAIGKELLPSGLQNTVLGRILDAYGSLARFPGRALVSSDEMTKGFLYRIELEKMAGFKYDDVLAAELKMGTDLKKAREIAELSAAKTLHNPDKATIDELTRLSREGTFTGELEGFFKDVQNTMNHPGMKLFVPFYRTIVNIFLEHSKRNPALWLLMPKVRKALLGGDGPAAQQLAASRLIIGATMMYQFGSFSYGVAERGAGMIITGRAPHNAAERDAFHRSGLQAYSINRRIGWEKDPETGEYLLQDPNYYDPDRVRSREASGYFPSEEDNRVPIYKSYSYARWEPIASMLGMAADTAAALAQPSFSQADYSQRHINAFVSGAGSIVGYLNEQPFLQGVSDIARIVQGGGSGDMDSTRFEQAFELLGEKLTSGLTKLNLLMPGSSLWRSLSRWQDPTVYDNTNSEDDFYADMTGPAGSFFQGVYKELNAGRGNIARVLAKGGVKVLSNYSRPKTNIFAQVAKTAPGSMFNPVKIVLSKAAPGYEDYRRVHFEFLKLGRYNPNRTAVLTRVGDKVANHHLGWQPKNDIIKYLNFMTDFASGDERKKVDGYILTEDGFVDKDGKMVRSAFIDDILEVMNEPDYGRHEISDRIAAIRSIYNKRLDNALNLVKTIGRYPKLSGAMIDEKKLKEKNEQIYKEKLRFR